MERRSQRARGLGALATGLAAAGLAAAIAGPRLARPSLAPHHVLAAQAWLDGRLALAGPPGPDRRLREDWARLAILQLDDGRTIRGIPCATEACERARRTDGRLRYWALVEGIGRRRLVSVAPARVVARAEQWHLGFPPGAALWLLPWVWLVGPGVSDVALTALTFGLAAAALRWALDAATGSQGGGSALLAVGCSLGTPALWLASHGNVWFTLQICGLLWCAVGLALWLRPGAGLVGPSAALALAASCRPHLGLGLVPLVAHALWVERRPAWRVLASTWPAALVVAGLLGYNVARFGDPIEFGHGLLDMRWQARVQTHGLFSPRWLGRNLYCALGLLPTPGGLSIHGVAVWVSSPWLLAAGWIAARSGADRAPAELGPHRARALWASAALVTLPSLLYHNTGQVQVAYRFVCDALPFVAVALALRWPRSTTAAQRWMLGLTLAGSLAFSGWTAWWYGRAPQRLFHGQPERGWLADDG